MSDTCIPIDQLLEPDPEQGFAIVNNNGSPAAFERNSTQLAQGAEQASITFVVLKLNANYAFNELAVRNVTDPNPLSIEPTVINKTKAGFTVGLAGKPDTANYFLDWEVEVTDV